MRTVQRNFILGAALLGCFALAPAEASAFWGRGCGCYCSPCYGYAGCGYGYGGYGYGYGGYGGYNSWGWYGYSAPITYYRSLANSSPATSRAGYPAPIVALAATSTSPAKPVAPSTEGILNVKVPAEARVFVNGRLTTSTGEARRYLSSDLVAGVSYTYEVRAELPGGASPVTETQIVKLSAGVERSLTFELNAATAKLPTSLTLYVPAEAKLTLGGHSTYQTGPVRTFKADLAAGNRYNDYLVRVELERNGKLLVRERKVSFAAGEQSELTIDFDSPPPSTVALSAKN